MNGSIAYGHRRWLIPDCYWPEESSPDAYPSHESICVLNTGTNDANIKLSFYFEDAPPVFAQSFCGAMRTHHIRLDGLTGSSDAPLLPRGKPYAAMFESDEPVIVQYSRCDSSHPAVTLATTIAYPVRRE